MPFHQEFSLFEKYVANEAYRKGNVHQADCQIVRRLSLSHTQCLVGESRCYQESLSRVSVYCVSLAVF